MRVPQREDLVELAAAAFRMGYIRGHHYAQPETREQVQDRLWEAHELTCANADWRRVHWTKFRQCYGAGFDIARVIVTQINKEQA